MTYGPYNITTENIENYEDFIVTDLVVRHSDTGEERQVGGVPLTITSHH